MIWHKNISRLLAWTMFAAAQTLSLCFLVNSLFGVLVFVLCHTAVFTFMSVALQSVVRYGNFDRYAVIQQFVNYFGLAVLVVIFTVGISGGAVFLLCGGVVLADFVPVLATEIWITVMVFVILIFYFKNKEKEIIHIQPVETKNRENIEQITIKTGQKLNVINVSDIYYLQADGDYVKICTEDKKFLKEQTLKYFDEHLPPDRFLRIHRSYIVNTQKITRIEQYGKQSMMLTLDNSEKLKVSTAGYKLLKMRLRI